MKTHSLNPDVMKKHMDLYLVLMFGPSKLTREERELIAVVVSSMNCCKYCINHHSKALNHYWNDDEKLKKFMQNFQSVDLSERKQHIIEYAVKLTKTPYLIVKNDIDILRQSGFSDEEILNINLITCYFNFVNRIALSLGVTFSKEEVAGYNY